MLGKTIDVFTIGFTKTTAKFFHKLRADGIKRGADGGHDGGSSIMPCKF